MTEGLPWPTYALVYADTNSMLNVGMSRADLQDQDWGQYGHFSADQGSAILNMDPSPIFFFFFLRQSTICGRTQTCIRLLMSAVWKLVKLESESTPTVTCNICNTTIARRGNGGAAFNNAHLIQHIKKQNNQSYTASSLKQHTLADTLKRKEKYPWDSNMAKNISENITEFIALDNQLISVVEDQGFLCHREFLNPWYALPSRHYITLLPLSSCNVPLCTQVSCPWSGHP